MKIISMRSQNMPKDCYELGVLHFTVEKSRGLTGQIVGLQRRKPFFISLKHQFLLGEPA
jgi:hypothetical protein